MALDEKPAATGRPTPARPQPGSSWLRWLAGAILVAVVAYFLVRAPLDPPVPGGGEGGALDDLGLPADAAPPPPPPRCRALEGAGYALGEVKGATREEDEPYDGLEPSSRASCPRRCAPRWSPSSRRWASWPPASSTGCSSPTG